MMTKYLVAVGGNNGTSPSEATKHLSSVNSEGQTRDCDKQLKKSISFYTYHYRNFLLRSRTERSKSTTKFKLLASPSMIRLLLSLKPLDVRVFA